MVVKKRCAHRGSVSVTDLDQQIEKIVQRGGTMFEESPPSSNKEIRFTLRIPRDMFQNMMNIISKRELRVSMNYWILESLSKEIKQHAKV